MMREARSLWRISLVALACGLVLAGASWAATAPGRVVFSVSDSVMSGFPGDGSVDGSVALPDGDFVLVGESGFQYSGFFAAELQPDGSLTRDFGVRGVVHVTAPLSPVQVLRGGDGKLLVLATAKPLVVFQFPQLMVVRLDANGTLDRTYGVDGVVRTGLEYDSYAGSAAISAAGELLVAGATGSYSHALEHNPQAPSHFRWVVEELTASGSRDPAFGHDGASTIAVNDAAGAQLAVLPGGGIVADGQTLQGSGRTYLTRLTDEGEEDPTFAGGAPLRTPFSGGIWGMVAQANGSVTLDSGDALARYTSAGALDAGFGAAGLATLPAGVGNGAGQILLGPGSDVLVAGFPPSHRLDEDGFARGQTLLDVDAIGPSGASDGSLATLALPFGGGYSSLAEPPFATSIPPTEDSFTGNDVRLLERPNGSYLVVGSVAIIEPSGSPKEEARDTGLFLYDFAAAAFTPTFAPDPSFGTTPTPPRVTLGLPAQNATTDLGQGWIDVALTGTFQGLVDITIRDRHGVIAQTAYPLFHAGTHNVPIQLTRLGNRDLSTRHGVPITIEASARDLLATSTTTTTHAALR